VEAFLLSLHRTARGQFRCYLSLSLVSGEERLSRRDQDYDCMLFAYNYILGGVPFIAVHPGNNVYLQTLSGIPLSPIILVTISLCKS